MTVAEIRAFVELRQAGKSIEEATAAIEQQRQLAQALGTPTGENVRRAVAERNVTGRWGKTRNPSGGN
jgi:hypothetical protein